MNRFGTTALLSLTSFPVLVQAAPAPTAWTPNKAMLTQLAAPVKVGNYELRPPKGYELKQQDGPDGSKTFGWVGKPDANGLQPYVMVFIVEVTPKGKKEASAMLDVFLRGIARRRSSDFKRTPTEQGTIGGVPFVRARWSGSMPQTKVAFRGFNYLSLSGGHLVQLSSQNVTPGDALPLKLAEASALTFRKVK